MYVKSNYSVLGISSNFLSNVNLMLVILLACPLLAGILMFAGHNSNSYRNKPRLLKYGKSFLFEVPFTVLLFNSFNIYTSMVVEIQSFGESNTIPLIISIVSSLLLPGMAILFILVRSRFCEFSERFDVT